jgi:hypothetical protein
MKGEQIGRQLRRLKRPVDELGALRELSLSHSDARVFTIDGCNGSLSQAYRDLDTRVARVEKQIRKLLMRAAADDDLRITFPLTGTSNPLAAGPTGVRGFLAGHILGRRGEPATSRTKLHP